MNCQKSDIRARAMAWIAEFGLTEQAVLQYGSVTWAVYFSQTCGKVVEVRSVHFEPTSVYMAAKAEVRKYWANRIKKGAQVLNL